MFVVWSGLSEDSREGTGIAWTQHRSTWPEFEKGFALHIMEIMKEMREGCIADNGDNEGERGERFALQIMKVREERGFALQIMR